MKRFINTTLALSISACLSSFCLGQQQSIEASIDAATRFIVRNVEEARSERQVAGGKLYIINDEERSVDDTYAFELDDDFKRRRSETAYPTLYSPGYAQGTILIIGFDGCVFCLKQMQAIPGVEVERNKETTITVTSSIYRLLYVKKDKPDAANKKDNPPTWDDLRRRLKISKRYPTTLIVERGNIKKSFSGFRPWMTIEPHVEACKLKQDKEPDDNEKPRRNRFFDFFFPDHSKPSPAIRTSRLGRALVVPVPIVREDAYGNRRAEEAK